MRFSILTVGLICTATLITACAKSANEGKGPNNSGAIDTARFTTTAPNATGGDQAGMPQAGGSSIVDSIPVATSKAVIATTVGDIAIDLYGHDAPQTVANFVGLARRKFYDSLAFHRVAVGFVIQAGDPKTRDTAKRSKWGSGGESIFGGPFADEVDPSTPSRRRGYVTGTLAMANSGPGTNLSQFFIVTNGDKAAALAQYNSYTIFGFVTEGLDVVRKIEATGLKGENVYDPVRIKTITVRDVAATDAAR